MENDDVQPWLQSMIVSTELLLFLKAKNKQLLASKTECFV